MTDKAREIMTDFSAWLTQLIGPAEPLRLLEREIAQALTAARTEGAQEERAKIMAWLRSNPKSLTNAHHFADAIARLDHLKEAPSMTPDPHGWFAIDDPDHPAPMDGSEVYLDILAMKVKAFWDGDLKLWVLSRPVHIESILAPTRYQLVQPAAPIAGESKR